MHDRLIVTAAAWLEIVVGALFLIVPDVPCMLLFAAKPEGVGVPLARFVGVALFALGIGCLPSKNTASRRNVVGLLVFNVGVTVLFVWVGITMPHGFLLWPVVILHTIIAGALVLNLVTKGWLF